jgi:hypothetical protein
MKMCKFVIYLKSIYEVVKKKKENHSAKGQQ